MSRNEIYDSLKSYALGYGDVIQSSVSPAFWIRLPVRVWCVITSQFVSFVIVGIISFLLYQFVDYVSSKNSTLSYILWFFIWFWIFGLNCALYEYCVNH